MGVEGINLSQLALQVWPGANSLSLPALGAPFSAGNPPQLNSLTGEAAAQSHSLLIRPSQPENDAIISGGIAVFRAVTNDKPPVKAWVGANFPKGSDIPARLQSIRNEGIKSPSDIATALDYLAILGPQFERVANIVRQRLNSQKLIIKVGDAKGIQNSSASLSFEGKINRCSEEFGEKITLGLYATPDILLHEIVHILPYSEVIALFGDIKTPAMPRLDPDGSFIATYKALLSMSRAHEIFSFSSQCLMYDAEKAKGIGHVFDEDMMSDIYGAWGISSMAGVATAFPYYMDHYEKREGLNALLMANVIKATGTVGLTWEEYKRTVNECEGDTYYRKQASLARKMLEEYVRKKGLIVPDDFFLMGFDADQATPFLGVSAKVPQRLAEALQAKFDAIDRLEEYANTAARSRQIAAQKISPEMIPPESSHENRKKLFAAYAAVVDSVLENPPGSFTREELASLISFVRMLPPRTASDVARRLMIYLDDATNDLGVALGIILYEKGFQAEGEALVAKFIDLNIFIESRHIIEKAMGVSVMIPLLRKCRDEYMAKREEVAKPFYLWANSHLVLAGLDPELASSIKAVLSYPELFEGDKVTYSWHEFGTWLIEHTDADYSIEDSHLLSLWRSAPEKLREDFSALGDSHHKLARILTEIKDVGGESSELSQSAAQIKEEMKALRKPAISALADIIGQSGEGAEEIDWGEALCEHALSEDEAKLLRSKLPKLQRDAFGILPEMRAEKIVSIMERAVRSVDAKKLEKAIAAVSIFKRFFTAAMTKPLDPSLIKKVPNLISALLKKIEDIKKELDDIGKFRDAAGEYFDIGGKHISSIAHLFLLTLHDEELVVNADIHWATAVMDIDPAVAGSYGVPLLRSFLERGIHHFKDAEDDNDLSFDWFVSDQMLPISIFLFDKALQTGDQELALSIRRFIIEEIPKHLPPDTKYIMTSERLIDDEVEEVTTKSTWGKSSHTYSAINKLRWPIDLAIEMTDAQKNGTMDVWLGRIKDEIERGGKNIGMGNLIYFATLLKRTNDTGHLKDVYRLMMLKSIASLGFEGVGDVKKVIEEIHKAPFSEDERDDLLCSYLERLLGYVDSFRGVDLSMVSKLDGLFVWKTPFMKAGDPPKYYRTEDFILAKLAGVDELVDPKKGKDDSVRLGAFAAAGLPLQRYHEWLASLMEEAEVKMGELMEQGASNFTQELERLALPHPYDIPAVLSAEKAGEYISSRSGKFRMIFEKEDEASFEVALRVISRLIGSELRSKGKAFLEDSATARFIIEWVVANVGNESLFGRAMRLIDVAINAGPSEVIRSSFMARLMDAPISLEIKRELFKKATAKIVLSSRVKNILEQKELLCMKVILSIRYKAHPGGMPSDFFMENMFNDPELREAYQNYLSGKKDDSERKDIVHPMIMAEVGTSSASHTMFGALAQWGSTDSIERMNLYLNAVKLLHRYFELFGVNGFEYTDSDKLSLKWDYIRGKIGEFEPYLKPFKKFARFLNEISESYTEVVDDDIMEMIEAVLQEAGFNAFIAYKLDEEVAAYDEEEEDEDEDEDVAADVMGEWFKGYIQKLEKYAADNYRSFMNFQRESPDIPEFVRARSGLEQDVLIWSFNALEPAQKNLLRQKLEGAKTDKERIFHLGSAAHLEKLMQLASVYPAVPLDLKKLFKVFWEDVPHRDKIDAASTMQWMLTDEKRGELDLDLDKPINEGTIGGVYKGSYNNLPYVFKLQPIGKKTDLMESLDIVAAVRTGLQASSFERPGARALDDFLAFYERVLSAEIDLRHEVKNAGIFNEFLSSDERIPQGFMIPEYDPGLADDCILAMKPVYSRRLEGLSVAERNNVYYRMDQFVLAMTVFGVVHFDLHPGNIGLTDDGIIVLYDMGRVYRMTDNEKEAMIQFQMSLVEGNIDAAINNLRMMGTVWDEKLFVSVENLIRTLIKANDPLKAIEDIFPLMPNYGFRLADAYIKLLLMHLTWNGTKKTIDEAHGQN